VSAHLTPREIKSRLDHPVIDADGHWIEWGPVFHEQLRKVGGDAAVRGFSAVGNGTAGALSMTVAERRAKGVSQEAFWSNPERNTLDRATAMFPKLLNERLDELGLDFAVIYPTGGLRVPRVADDEGRRAASRAYNVVTMDYFRPFTDRMTPAAIIPMHTPEEAIAELEFAVKQLGYKVAMFGSLMERPLTGVDGAGDAKRFAVWQDVIGMDSCYDYDPVWAKCLELGIAPSFHSGARRAGLRLSPSNFTYNHVGHFAAANHAACKAMFLGGVTRRFPGLNISFLEGGSGWACMLYGDLLSHWEKRSRQGLEETDPRNLARGVLMEMAEKYGGSEFVAALKERDGWPTPGYEKLTGGVADLDDYAACKISRKEDWHDLYVEPFYFGCEADDPSNIWAFNTKANPLGARLNAIFSSDVGHFDVPDMTGVLPEAYEMVEDGLATAADFRDFTFANVVRLFGRQSPNFFAGTRVAKEAAAVLAATKSPARAAAE
jgi:predicted TIM-barrel fold metal-dependent hydrolase